MKLTTNRGDLKPILLAVIRSLNDAISTARNEIEKLEVAQSRVQVPRETTIELERNLLLLPIRNEQRKAYSDLKEAEKEGVFTLLRRLGIKRTIGGLEKKLADMKNSAQYSHDVLMKQVKEHNDFVKESSDRKNRYSAAVAVYNESLKSCEVMYSALTELNRTATQGGWVSSKCISILQSVHAQLRSAEYSELAKFASQLVYQKMPPDSLWDEWMDDAKSVLNVAHRDAMAGFIPLTAFEVVAERVCELTLPWCKESVSQEVKLHSVPVDRWHQLVGLMLTPGNLIHPLHWALYWSNFKASQEFASDCIAAAHEDNYSGRFLSNIGACAKTWAAPRIGKMGFPTAKVLFGTLSLGGLKAESRLGADLGIIVDIDIGGLLVRKVALLQAKKSSNGNVEVGSEQTGAEKMTQLQKLDDEERDFYIFYHQAYTHATWPGPTVIAAAKIARTVTDLGIRNISFDTRSGGWDWPTFLAFGLCAPDSGVGRQLEAGEDALKVLGSGDRRSLPETLLMISASGSDYSLKLILEIQQHYKEFGTRHENKKTLNSEGPSYRQ